MERGDRDGQDWGFGAGKRSRTLRFEGEAHGVAAIQEAVHDCESDEGYPAGDAHHPPVAAVLVAIDPQPESPRPGLPLRGPGALAAPLQRRPHLLDLRLQAHRAPQNPHLGGASISAIGSLIYSKIQCAPSPCGGCW